MLEAAQSGREREMGGACASLDGVGVVMYTKCVWFVVLSYWGFPDAGNGGQSCGNRGAC